MSRFCLAVARFCPSAWVGAAFLFVATSVAEQVEPSFVRATKDTLALIRFPWFYGTGFTLLALTALAVPFARLNRRPRAAAMALVIAALAITAGDYVLVYRPMRRMILSAAERGPDFARLHEWSERLNGVAFLLAAAAAVILCATRIDATRPDDRRA